jgi:hypothetical protein
MQKSKSTRFLQQARMSRNQQGDIARLAETRQETVSALHVDPKGVKKLHIRIEITYYIYIK